SIRWRSEGAERDIAFRDSDPKLYSSLNMPTGGIERHTLLLIGFYFALFSSRAGILVNAGSGRPFRSRLEPGSVLYPEFPAAVGMRSLTALRLQDVVFGCLAQ